MKQENYTVREFYTLLREQFNLTNTQILNDIRMLKRNSPSIMEIKFFYNDDDLQTMTE